MSRDALITILPRLFAASHLRQLIWYQGSSDLLPFVRDFIIQEASLPARPTLGNLLNGAFEIMRRERPVEYVFKSFLLRRRFFGRHSPRTTSCYLELEVGASRADMVLVNGQPDVFEIKSRYDSTARLEPQLREYYRCFTRVTVVTDEKMASAYLGRLPSHVGVATLSRRGFISTKRKGRDHHEELQHDTLFRMLHQAERHEIAKEVLGLKPLEIPPMVRFRQILKRFTSSLSAEDAHGIVVAKLKRRQPTTALALRSRPLPKSLKVIPFSYRLRKPEWAALLHILECPVH